MADPAHSVTWEHDRERNGDDEPDRRTVDRAPAHKSFERDRNELTPRRSASPGGSGYNELGEDALLSTR